MPQKTCFVTIGATASFSSLIKAVLSTKVCTALESEGYDKVIVQYGADGKELFDSCRSAVRAAGSLGLEIIGFDLDKSGLGSYMREAKGAAEKQGVVISHAGSGTILDALRIAVPIIVVPNEELLDNHQVELAEALAEQEYVVHGRLADLPKAIREAEDLRKRQKAWPPPNSGVRAQSLKTVLNDEMGFLD